MPKFSVACTQGTEELYLTFFLIKFTVQLAPVDFLLIQMTSKSNCTQSGVLCCDDEIYYKQTYQAFRKKLLCHSAI